MTTAVDTRRPARVLPVIVLSPFAALTAGPARVRATIGIPNASFADLELFRPAFRAMLPRLRRPARSLLSE